MYHRLKIRSIRLAICALALSSGFTFQVHAQKKATVTLSGSRNGPVTVTEHSSTGDHTIFLTPIRIKQTIPQARRADPHPDNALEGQDLQAVEAKSEANPPEALPGDSALDQSAKAQTPPPEDQPEAISVAEGLKRLRAQNWITYSEGDTDIPQLVYNPQTKRFVPTLEAIQSLQAAPEPPEPRKFKRYGFKPRQ